ncbi:hypothetical protein Agub_g3008 [Astrephomene gubernaculifera]|uniref:Uncharacterized protein n=1 Tax=Astrephomene gubernaculifera TaxID=47775 RepID=A0AAD3HIU2_9CHLO|nr:hypothetical protein Agub_g3008 [Astrephomene gubernaculifera]
MEVEVERARAALLGAFIADAATSPLHWIYNRTILRDTLTKPVDHTAAPEFFERPSCLFYKAVVGALSPYGQELLPLVTFLAAHGECEPQEWAKYLAAHYASDSPPLVYLNHSAKAMRDRVAEGRPWPECGEPNDNQANCFVKVPALVALYGGRSDGGTALRRGVEAAVRAQQNNDTAVELAWAAARVLERVMVTGGSVESALQWVLGPEGGLGERAVKSRDAVREVLEKKDVDPRSLMYGAPGPEVKFGPWGAGCSNPGCLKAALLVALQAPDYVSGVRGNLLLGGDNCSRAVLVGALLAARGGPGCIPSDWVSKTLPYVELEEAVSGLIEQRLAVHAAAGPLTQPTDAPIGAVVANGGGAATETTANGKVPSAAAVANGDGAVDVRTAETAAAAAQHTTEVAAAESLRRAAEATTASSVGLQAQVGNTAAAAAEAAATAAAQAQQTAAAAEAAVQQAATSAREQAQEARGVAASAASTAQDAAAAAAKEAAEQARQAAADATKRAAAEAQATAAAAAAAARACTASGSSAAAGTAQEAASAAKAATAHASEIAADSMTSAATARGAVPAAATAGATDAVVKAEDVALRVADGAAVAPQANGHKTNGTAAASTPPAAAAAAKEKAAAEQPGCKCCVVM